MRSQSLSLGETLIALPNLTPQAKIERAYWRTLGRAPDAKEIGRAIRFLARFRAEYRKLPHEPSPAAAALTVKAVEPDSAGFTLPADPDNVDRTEYIAAEDSVQPSNAEAAAWMSFVQALYASAEFRFVR